jgi:hypothetical protein
VVVVVAAVGTVHVVSKVVLDEKMGDFLGVICRLVEHVPNRRKQQKATEKQMKAWKSIVMVYPWCLLCNLMEQKVNEMMVPVVFPFEMEPKKGGMIG